MSWYHILRLIPTIYAILIILIITCIFTRGFTNIHLNLIDKLHSFDYPRTYVELYFLMLFDSFVLIFSSFVIFLFKRCQRFKYIRLVLIIFQLITYGYSLSKFLVFMNGQMFEIQHHLIN